MGETLLTTDYFTVKKMAEGVFAAIAIPGRGAWSNAGIVDLGTELLVFDSFNTPSAARELKKQAENLTGKKVKYLVNSHYHGDHVFGNQVFEEAVIISTALTQEWFRDKNVIRDIDTEMIETQQYINQLEFQIYNEKETVVKESLENQYMEMAKLHKELPSLEMVVPTVLFEKKLVISGAERSVELYCFGGAHSPSDAFLYAPMEKVAFMGDLVTENLHLPIFHPEEFLRILLEVKTMDIEQIMPGHGDVGTMKQVDRMIEYLAMLRKAVIDALSYSVSLDDFVSNFVIPDGFRNWKGTQGIKRNLESVYNFYSLKQKEF
ncbi:MBL fold metallo-hydrolase [Planococcus sp. N028]|uniref:MBL fold metallo-hydrolase n=1 Tax=Planococcus shixiaomingii TaxID=3058393 RepID=A0ABT8MYM8_9BACL|nr:MBL fold metallo-hydrolase [Planococcus sp. N028]MDN7240733.1 MBL fold metallo-hydrolase [Planococcus sp. N028]